MFPEVRAYQGRSYGLDETRLGDLNHFDYAHALTRLEKYSIETERKLNAGIGGGGPVSDDPVSRGLSRFVSDIAGYCDHRESA
jgi:hypothetical protein